MTFGGFQALSPSKMWSYTCVRPQVIKYASCEVTTAFSVSSSFWVYNATAAVTIVTTTASSDDEDDNNDRDVLNKIASSSVLINLNNTFEAPSYKWALKLVFILRTFLIHV